MMNIALTTNTVHSRFGLLSALLAVGLCGCGGGSNNSTSMNPNPGGTTLASGQFVDQIVSGLQYDSGSQIGLTDTRGGFVYETGATVTFKVGAVVIGTVPAKNLITPVSLVPGSDAANTSVRNIARFLIMLDQDQNPSNGITISPAVRTAAAGWITPNFSSASFDTDIQPIVVAANLADNGGTTNPLKTLPSAVVAQDHLTASIRCANTGMYSGNWSGTYTPPGTGFNGSWRSVVDPVGGVIAGRSINNLNNYWTQSGTTTTSESGNYLVSATSFSMTGTLLGDSMSGTFTDTATIPNSTGTGTITGIRQVISLPSGATGTVYRGVAYGETNLPAGYRTLVTLLFTVNGSAVLGTAVAEHYIPANGQNPAQLVLAQYGLIGNMSGNTFNAQIVDTANNVVANGTGSLPTNGPLSGTWSSPLTGESGALRACRAF